MASFSGSFSAVGVSTQLFLPRGSTASFSVTGVGTFALETSSDLQSWKSVRYFTSTLVSAHKNESSANEYVRIRCLTFVSSASWTLADIVASESLSYPYGNYLLEPLENDNGNSSTSKEIDWSSAAAQRVTLTGNCTFTFSNPQVGGAYVLLVETGAGSFAATWPANVKWAADAEPDVTSGASRLDIFNFYYDGTNYYGTVAQDFEP